MADTADTNENDEQVQAEADTAHSDAAPEPGDADSDAAESGEDPSASENGEPAVGESDAVAVDGEAEPGEGAAEPGDPATPPASNAPWESELREAREEVRRLRAQWDQATPLLMQVLDGQRKPQPQEPPKKSSWAPHADDPEVREALDVMRANPKAFEELPPVTREKARQTQTFLSKNWNRFMLDPERFVEEIVLPALDRSKWVETVRSLEEDSLRRRGREAVGKHSDVIKTPQDEKEVLETMSAHQVPFAAAVRMVALQRQVAGIEREKLKLSEKAKSQAALSDRTRAAQGTKRGNRPGKPSAELFGTRDPRAIYERLKAEGRLSDEE